MLNFHSFKVINYQHCFNLLDSFKSEGSGVPKYKDEAKELVRPERNTLEVLYNLIDEVNSLLNELHVACLSVIRK